MTTTMSEHRGANKRALECDCDDEYGGDGVPKSMESDSKKPKLQPSSPSSPPPTPSRDVKDIRVWELLPAVVYELLTLIKKSEKQDPGDGGDAQRDNSAEEINEKTKVLSNSKDQNEINDIENKKENLKERLEIVDKKSDVKLLNTEESNKLLTSVEDSVKCIEKLNLPPNKTGIINVKMETTSTTEITDIKIENVQKEYQKRDETNEKEDTFKTILTKNIPNNNVGNNISKIENLIMVSKKKDLLNLLKNCCSDGTSKIPTTKPYPCSCKYCLYASNLPKDQWVVNNLFTSDNSNLTYCNSNDIPASSSMYVSEISVFGCLVCGKNNCCCVNNLKSEKKTKTVETSNNDWIKDLTSLIKNNEMLNYLKRNLTDSKSLIPIENDESVTEQIKSHLSLCEICKKSKNSNSTSVCKCNYGYCHTNSKNKSF